MCGPRRHAATASEHATYGLMAVVFLESAIVNSVWFEVQADAAKRVTSGILVISLLSVPMVILIYEVAAKSSLLYVAVHLLRLLDWAREEIDRGLTSWPNTKASYSQPKKVGDAKEGNHDDDGDSEDDEESLALAITWHQHRIYGSHADLQQEFKNTPKVPWRCQPINVVRGGPLITQPEGDILDALEKHLTDVRKWKSQKIRALHGTEQRIWEKRISKNMEEVSRSSEPKIVTASSCRQSFIESAANGHDNASLHIVPQCLVQYVRRLPRQNDRFRVKKPVRAYFPLDIFGLFLGVAELLRNALSPEPFSDPTKDLPRSRLDLSEIQVTYESTPPLPLNVDKSVLAISLNLAKVLRRISNAVARLPASTFATEAPDLWQMEILSSREDSTDTDDTTDGEDADPRMERSLLGPMKNCAESAKLVKAIRLLDVTTEIPCYFLTKWPLEIRRLVYLELVVVGFITHANELVEESTTALVISEAKATANKIGLHAAILRTCRNIYDEALPMLYGENNFIFCTPTAIETFRDKGLVQLPPPSNPYLNVASFNFTADCQGRFSMLRKLTLWLTNGSGYRDRQHHHGTCVPSRKDIIDTWSGFLQQSRYQRRTLNPFAGFPVLEDLTLDFTDWFLGADDRIVARPFVERFRTTEGLRRLEIRGVKHAESLGALREGLLKKDGLFIVTD